MENRKEKIELLKPKYDVVFQALFGQIGQRHLVIN